MVVSPDPGATLDYLQPAIGFAVAFVVALLVGRVAVLPAVDRLVRRHGNRTIATAAHRFTRAGVLTLAVVAGLAAAGYTRLLTGSAVIIAAATLGISVAGQAVIGNLVSGVFLVVDPDFNVGDWIEWQERAGRVEDIGFRVTRVRTAANEQLTVPNTELTTSELRAPFEGSVYRASTFVYVDYTADLDAVREVLVAAAETDDRIRDRPAPTPLIASFEGDGIELEARYWITDPTFGEVQRVKAAYARRVREGCRRVGVPMGLTTGLDISGNLAVDRRGPVPAEASEQAVGANSGDSGE